MTSINDGVLLEFLNQNMHRNYPIQDTCVVKTADDVYLPSSFLVDCQILVPCESDAEWDAVDTGRFFVSDVNHYTNSVQVVISYQPTSGDTFQCACSSAIVLADSVYPVEVTLTPTAGIPEDSPLQHLSGKLWIGSTANMANLGSLHFSYADAALYNKCIIKNRTSAISYIKVLNASGDIIASLTGAVTLQAGTGIILSYDEATNTLTIAVDSTWLTNRIRELTATAGTAIRSINGQAPDATGNFTISGLDCTDIKNYSGTNGIAVTNTCSKPCCGGESDDLVDIKDSQATLQVKVDRISENLNSFINSINNVETRLPSLVASRK